MPAISTDDTYIELVTFAVENTEMQRALIDALTRQVEEWIKRTPGFISASFHASHDGKKVFNYAQWQSRAAWEIFAADERRSHIRQAVKDVNARHISGEGYSVFHIVEA